MIVGVPREVKEGERRVALLPLAVEEIVAAGHDVLVETRAGLGAGFDDNAYREMGAAIVVAKDAWDAELIVKVKEVQDADLALIPPDAATIFSFHHLPREPERTRALAAKGVTAIAFEMVRDARGEFPLLAPMSALAGRMTVETLLKPGTDPGFLPRGKPGSVPGLTVLVLGAGHAGTAAAEAARKRGAKVTVLQRADATPENIGRAALEADVVIGAVFVAGQPTPKLLPRSLVKRMKPGAMIVDISIDAGGVAETSRPTTHAKPTYVEEGVTHYCVPNIPAADPPAASKAISEAALPYVLDLANHGIAEALMEFRELREAVLLWRGQVNHAGIAAEAGLPYTPLTDSALEEMTE
jgi:alanine dehydrogenase